MATIKIGYRRLYDAMGCSFATRKEYGTSFAVGATRSDVYIGPQPRFGVTVIKADKYIIPGSGSLMMAVDHQKDASQSTYPRHFFTEIVCWKRMAIDADLLTALQTKQPNAADAVFALLRDEETLLRATVDYVAGIIGLRFHRQLVREVVSENLVAPIDVDDYAFTVVGPGVELLDQIGIPERGVSELAQTLVQFGQIESKIREMGVAALGWLLRAWSEPEDISKFMSLFIPLEIILSGVTAEAIYPPTAHKLRELIQNHGAADGDELLKFFEQLLQRPPSLATRFEVMAQQANMPGMEADIKAFKKFNRIRNSLFHQGEQKVPLAVTVGEEEVRQLEDITERYVSWRLFGDARVYISSFRNPQT